ncbi:MAG: glycosyltransferase family 9 protein [Chitinivibrionales bacterium]|nr:glycosyltransferase family 9 protein [Chitinivibrionales bacterium]
MQQRSLSHPTNSFFDSRTRLLLCLRYGIGDVVMETPLFDAIRRVAPGAYVTALGADPALELLRSDSRIDQLEAIQRWGFGHWYDEGDEQRVEEFRRWLQAASFDVILDISHATAGVRHALWTYATCPMLDSDYAAVSQALQQGVGGLEALRRAVEQGWGIPVPEELRPRLHVSMSDRQFASMHLSHAGISPTDTVIGMSVEASSALKRWPLGHFAAVADAVLDSADTHLLLFVGGGTREADSMVAMMRLGARVHQVRSARLGQVAALLPRCAAFVCNDTGLMHMAGAMDVPVTAMFGPTCPGIYLPNSVTAKALGGWRKPCAYRKRTSFGPPLCVAAGHCLVDSRSCIGLTGPDEVIEVVMESVANGLP